MPKVPLAVRIDADLLARIDLAAGDVPRTRWIVRALERALSGDPTMGAHLPKEPRGLTETPCSARRAAPTRTPNGKAKRVAVFASLAEEIKDIRHRPDLSLAERVGLESQAKERWRNE